MLIQTALGRVAATLLLSAALRGQTMQLKEYDALSAPSFGQKDYFSRLYYTPDTRVQIADPIKMRDYVSDGKLQLSLRNYLELVLSNNTSINLQKVLIQPQRNAIQRAFSIFDPFATARWQTTRQQTPTTDALQGAATLSQLTQPLAFGYNQTLDWGTVISANYAGNKTSTNNTFANFNPAFSSKAVFNFCVNDSGHIAFKTNLKIAKATTFSWISDNSNRGIPPKGADSSITFKALSNNATEVITTQLTVLAVADGCKAQTQAAINIKPRPVLFNPGNLFIAMGQRVVLHFTADIEGTTFDWTNNKTEVGLPLSGSGDLDFMAKINNSNTTITANITATPNLNGCIEQAQMFTITLPPTPSVSTPLATIPNKTGDK